MPLVQSVPGLGAQHPGCLLLLEILDEGHGSVGAGQVVAPWGGRNERKMFEDGQEKETKQTRQ